MQVIFHVMNIIFKNAFSVYDQHFSLMEIYELETELEIPLTLKLSDFVKNLNNCFPLNFPICHFLMAQVTIFFILLLIRWLIGNSQCMLE